MNRELSKGELIFLLSILPFIMYYSDDIGTGLLVFGFIWIPLGAVFYILRWYLDR